MKIFRSAQQKPMAHAERKFLSVVGARPNFVKLFPIHRALAKQPIDHIVVHTGQHYDYEMSKVFFENLQLPEPHYNLNVGSGSPCYQLGEMIARLEGVLLKENPKAVLVYGDTNSTLAGALAAAKLNFPVAHIEAGLRSFDRRMPEEVNRVLTDHVSNNLFCPTKNALRNLRKEHVWGKAFLTGDVMVETLNEYVTLAEKKSTILDRLNVEPKKYILVTIHRAENTENQFRLSKIVEALTKIKKRIVFPIHPRTVKALKEYLLIQKLASNSNIILTEPLSYLDFIHLERQAEKIITDSGGVQKEAYLLGVPCITIRENTEWIETIETGWNTLVGTDLEKICEAVENFEPASTRKPIFGKGNASIKIANILFDIYLS
jgi:UDP-N-acetylglucosamine 2-epimerase (non-hydrolysing)